MNTNVVIESGNITRQPELKTLPNGTNVLSFAIAHNESYYNKTTKHYDNNASYFECVLFGNAANYWCKRLNVGDHILVEGKLQQDRWEKNGQRFSQVKIIVNNIEEFNYLSKRQNNSSNNNNNNYNNSNNNDYEQSEYDASSYYGDNGGFVE